ncbi:TPA: glycosyltransferase family 2 protein [Escherichia coli]
MTRNEGADLQRCVDSILHTVSIDVHIYIIDNNSDDLSHIQILANLEDLNRKNLTVIRNTKNLWILGVNNTLLKIKKNHDTKYFILTDGDIDFHSFKEESCWLTYLINKMESNMIIGKLGISLDWSFLASKTEMKDIYRQEQNLYNERRKIGDLYISAVDTTVAIYRWDWSIERKALFYPDHMRYLRPELYSCRTKRGLTVEHLGWYRYLDNSLSTQSINSKVFCFTIVGGTVKPEVLKLASKPYQYFHILFSKPFAMLWYFRRYFKLFIYFITKGRRGFDGQS